MKLKGVFIMQFLFYLNRSISVKILLVMIVFDTIFGILRAVKERKVNSAIGIDGMIRKVGMIMSIIFLGLVDYITELNLVGFIPQEVLEIFGIETVGISTLFNLLFIVFEFLSVIKNMILCKLPVPIKFQKKLEEIFLKYTKELPEKESEEIEQTE